MRRFTRTEKWLSVILVLVALYQTYDLLYTDSAIGTTINLFWIVYCAYHAFR